MSHESDPGRRYVAVTPSDTTSFGPCRALYVGTGGDVVVVGIDGVAATFANVQSGTILPCHAKRVNLTDTTASDIVALY